MFHNFCLDKKNFFR